MSSSLTSRQLSLAGGALAACAVTIGVLLMSIPPVVGLGDRVKLPLFHGGSTWVNLLLFTFMGGLALVYLIRRSPGVYAWEFGLRAVAAPLWLVNSVLGFIAASATWDFSGSKESPLVMISGDPRLRAQVVLLLIVVAVMLADWIVLEKRLHKALLDVAFVIGMWALLADVLLDPVKRAMHPDSPVLNSGWEIKGPFFGMVVGILVAAIVLAWVASSFAPAPASEASQAE
jgi:hypothetical protein